MFKIFVNEINVFLPYPATFSRRMKLLYDRNDGGKQMNWTNSPYTVGSSVTFTNKACGLFLASLQSHFYANLLNSFENFLINFHFNTNVIINMYN